MTPHQAQVPIRFKPIVNHFPSQCLKQETSPLHFFPLHLKAYHGFPAPYLDVVSCVYLWDTEKKSNI